MAVADGTPTVGAVELPYERHGHVIYRYPVLVRVAHWTNLLCLAILLMSGLQIFNAHPALYWGEDSQFDNPLLSISTASTRGFPGWMTIPSRQDLATGRVWHLFFAWLFVVNRLLASLRTADAEVCELAGRTLTNQWGWASDGDFAAELMPVPMPTPMPVPMPMPFADDRPSISGPSVSDHPSMALDAKVLAVFRAGLRDQSRCVRRIAARMVAREEPTWAASEFGAPAKDAAPASARSACSASASSRIGARSVR
jgi:hypothetical protein